MSTLFSQQNPTLLSDACLTTVSGGVAGYATAPVAPFGESFDPSESRSQHLESPKMFSTWIA
jgi:hypothetical protein